MLITLLHQQQIAVYNRSIPDTPRTSQSGTPHIESNIPDWGWVIDKLLQIRNLENDWDGEGSNSPDKLLVDSAIRLTQLLKDQGMQVPDLVHPSVNGTVLFEWHTPVFYGEMEILSPDKVRFMMIERETGFVVDSFEFAL